LSWYSACFRLGVRERELVAPRPPAGKRRTELISHAEARSIPCAGLSDDPARRRLDLRERKLVASGVAHRPGASAFELFDGAARCRLVLCQRRLGSAQLAARTG
jgi:hypothetical protein